MGVGAWLNRSFVRKQNFLGDKRITLFQQIKIRGLKACALDKANTIGLFTKHAYILFWNK